MPICECDTVSDTPLTHHILKWFPAKAMIEGIIFNRWPISLCENSKLLGKHNIMYMIALLNKKGFYVHEFQAWAEEYGSASYRHRQYLAVVDTGEDSIDQTADGYETPSWVPMFVEFLARLKCPPCNVDDFLFRSASVPFYAKFLEEQVRATLSRSLYWGITRSLDPSVNQSINTQTS